MHYLLIYEVADDYLDRRGLFRNEHLKLAWQAHSKGQLILGGALQQPTDTAILFFKGDDPEVASSFAENDPYVLNGLIKKWSVRPWITVVGDLADTPIKIDE
jgi:uncharacterized protein